MVTELLAEEGFEPVSYTHLDVYKRQACALFREEGGDDRFAAPDG